MQKTNTIAPQGCTNWYKWIKKDKNSVIIKKYDLSMGEEKWRDRKD